MLPLLQLALTMAQACGGNIEQRGVPEDGGAQADRRDAGFSLPPCKAAPGALDPDFGEGGLTGSLLARGDAFIAGLNVDPLGRILLVGSVDSPDSLVPTIVRVQPNGVLDPSIGEGGVTMTPVSGGGTLHGLTIQPDGTIIALGRLSEPRARDILIRYTSDGRLDTTSGVNGVLELEPQRYAFSLRSDPSGRLVMTGPSGVDDWSLFVARLRSDGSYDSGFGTGGIVQTQLASLEVFGRDVSPQADGAIVIVGGST